MMKWLVVLMSVAVVGCGSQPINYYWGDYSGTLFQLKEFPSEEATAEHIESLEEIITESDERGFRPPPGIQVELGYRYILRGDEPPVPVQFFEGELEDYPESAVFLQRLMESLGI